MAPSLAEYIISSTRPKIQYLHYMQQTVNALKFIPNDQLASWHKWGGFEIRNPTRGKLINLCKDKTSVHLFYVHLFPSFRCIAMEMKKQKASNTRYSQEVTHPSTILARRHFTAVFGREPVFPTWYGR